MKGKSELILEIGAEGGEIAIWGTRASHGWLFRSSVGDQSAMFLSEDDRGELPLEIRNDSDWVDSLEAALAFIDKYPWHGLYPLTVHPEFKQQIWAAVQARVKKEREERGSASFGQHYIGRWRELCGM